MFRPAGLSDSEDDDLECFLMNEDHCTTAKCEKTDSSEPVDPLKGFSSLNTSEDPAEGQVPPSLKHSLICNGQSPTTSSLNVITNGTLFMQNGSLYQCSKSHLEVSPRLKRRNLSQSATPSPQASPKSWRKFCMHEGYALPLEELRMAAIQGNLPIIKSILKQGMAVDQLLKSGWTALMYACSAGKPDVVEYLLQNGADANLHKECFTPLMAACASSLEEEARLLDCVKLLLSHGAQVDTLERHRMTALMFASKEGRKDIVKKLLETKADVNRQDNKGWSALCWAATKGHGCIVRLLLSYSADPLKVNVHGQCAADVAITAGYPEIADLLDRLMMSRSVANGDVVNERPEDCPLILNEEPGVHPSERRVIPYSKSAASVQVLGDVEMVLSGLDLAHLIPIFQQNAVTLDIFLRLTDEDLDRMGIKSVGVQKKILSCIHEFHTQEWKPSSLVNLQKMPFLTVHDAVAMVRNINKHLRFIHASIGYLRGQIQSSPRVLELGQEVNSVTTLSSQCGDSMKHLGALVDEIRFFKKHLDKVSNNAEYVPADLIVERRSDRSMWRRRIIATLASATAFATAVWLTRPQLFCAAFSLYTYPTQPMLFEM